LVEEFAKREDSGQGAFVFDGQMIDKPRLLQVKNVRGSAVV
jgi:citrate lyase beta subunit